MISPEPSMEQMADALIRSAESLRLETYDDTTGLPVPTGASWKGTLTIGYGHTGPDVTPGMCIEETTALSFLQRDRRTATVGAARVLGASCWAALDASRQAALVDMCFNLGETRLAGFHDMLGAIREAEWDSAYHAGLLAHDEIVAEWTAAHNAGLDSLWAKQVKSRAVRDMGIMLTGELPEGLVT